MAASEWADGIFLWGLVPLVLGILLIVCSELQKKTKDLERRVKALEAKP